MKHISIAGTVAILLGAAFFASLWPYPDVREIVERLLGGVFVGMTCIKIGVWCAEHVAKDRGWE